MKHLSTNCRNQQDEPKPHGCSGGDCQCWCHAASPPSDFRAQVEAAKAKKREED